MSDKQIQPVRNRDYQITQRSRPRSLWGQVWMALLQPGYFFRTLPLMEDTRTWLWAAVLILALTGISAVRQDQMLNGGGGSAPPVDFGGNATGGDLGGSKGEFQIAPIDGGGGGGGEIPFDPGNVPTTPGAVSTRDVSTTWTTALLASAAIVVGWFVLTAILSEVTLFNGRVPSLGQNLQVAIWATIPFALMALLQLIYYAAGGQPRSDGLSGLLAEWNAYTSLPSFWQSVILSLTSRLTLFWLWSLILIYIGARNALRGKRWASAIVVVVWAVLLVVVPVVTGTVKAPEDNVPDILSPDSFTTGEGQFSEDSLNVPGEENLTGELQGRFAEREQNSGTGSESAAPAQTESEVQVSPSNSNEGDIPQTEAEAPVLKPVAPPAGD
jgi:hypothetical protein